MVILLALVVAGCEFRRVPTPGAPVSQPWVR